AVPEGARRNRPPAGCRSEALRPPPGCSPARSGRIEARRASAAGAASLGPAPLIASSAPRRIPHGDTIGALARDKPADALRHVPSVEKADDLLHLAQDRLADRFRALGTVAENAIDLGGIGQETRHRVVDGHEARDGEVGERLLEGRELRAAVLLQNLALGLVC